VTAAFPTRWWDRANFALKVIEATAGESEHDDKA
jgi:hypothetical protein